jgi:hypothetical protein
MTIAEMPPHNSIGRGFGRMVRGGWRILLFDVVDGCVLAVESWKRHQLLAARAPIIGSFSIGQ